MVLFAERQITEMRNIKSEIRKIVFSKMSDENIDKFYHIYYKFRYPSEVSKRCSFGNKNEDIVFYVIRPRKDCTEGLMSLFMNVAKNIHYACSNGYKPIVDFKNYKTQYHDEKNPDVNVWEDYFTQPTEYTLEEVYESKNVILSGMEMREYRPELYKTTFSDQALMALHEDIFSKIDFNQNILDMVLEEEKRLNLDYEKTLALYMRGTDYLVLRPAGHPVQPTVDDAIPIINEFLEKYNLSNIFLVTEDGNIFKQIKDVYGDMCTVVSFDQFVNSYNGKNYLSHDKSINELSDSPYIRGSNYLIKLLILSRCSYFVGGNTMGAWAACTFSDKGFKDKYVFDLGLYGR